MSLNFLIFFSYYFIILIAIVGYGYFLLSFEKINKSFFDFGYVGLFGIFFLIIYSYISNIFISHSKAHNLIFILVGFLGFFFFLKRYSDKFLFKRNLIFFILIFLILFISLLIKKNHDDFPYYHFAYTFHLTQDSLSFGIGKLNHGFRTPSSIFYLNSLFYLPLADYYLFNFSSVYILGFTNIILLKKIFNLDENLNRGNNKLTFINYLSLLSFVFVNIFFYRISEYGTDRSAQILVLILFIYLLENFQNKNYMKEDLIFTYILIGLIISFKSFYFLYLIFSIPFFLFFIEKEKKFQSALIKIFFNKYFIYLAFSILFVLLTNFNNTGCLLYPVSFTCFENFQWSIPLESVSKMNDWYELWSKAGANPNYRVQNPEQYIIGFNWVNNWVNEYFFNKVFDFIVGLLVLVFIFYTIFFMNKKNTKKPNITKNVKTSKLIFITYLILVLILFEWFYNHPALRYGGYCVVALIIFIPFSIYLNKINITYKKYSKIALILVLISIFTFETRNYLRIVKEINIYGYKPMKETFYSIDKKYFSIQKRIENLKNSKGLFSKTIF